jgi:hypothetical protein
MTNQTIAPPILINAHKWSIAPQGPIEDDIHALSWLNVRACSSEIKVPFLTAPWHTCRITFCDSNIQPITGWYCDNHIRHFIPSEENPCVLLPFAWRESHVFYEQAQKMIAVSDELVSAVAAHSCIAKAAIDTQTEATLEAQQ